MAKQSARRPTSGRSEGRGSSSARGTRRAEADEALRRQQRTQRIVLAMGILVLAAFVVGMVLAFRSTGDESAAGGTGTTATTLSSVPEVGQTPPTAAGPPVDTPVIAPGEQLDGPTPCPALDGSAPRVTSFAEAPPLCIDPAFTYNLTVRTSVGDLDYFINPQVGQAAVNNFLVLAAYHYYDGLPLTRIDPLVDAQVTPAFDDPPGVSSPGYPVPLEVAPTIVNPGTLALLGSNDPGREAAGFKVALGQDAVGWSPDTPIFGVLLDGLETLQAIRAAGTPQSGAPTSVITIESMLIEQGGEAKTPPGGATP